MRAMEEKIPSINNWNMEDYLIDSLIFERENILKSLEDNNSNLVKAFEAYHQVKKDYRKINSKSDDILVNYYLNPYKYLRDLLPEKITQRNILK